MNTSIMVRGNIGKIRITGLDNSRVGINDVA